MFFGTEWPFIFWSSQLQLGVALVLYNLLSALSAAGTHRAEHLLVAKRDKIRFWLWEFAGGGVH